MTVTVDWAAEPRLVTDQAVAEAVEAALDHGGRPGIDLGVVLVDDAGLAAMHGEWLDDPTPTDVITFDLADDPTGPAGELYVSVECAGRVARERELDPQWELLLYVVHGTLHLCGFDDHEDDDRARMRAAEAAVLERLGRPRAEA